MDVASERPVSRAACTASPQIFIPALTLARQKRLQSGSIPTDSHLGLYLQGPSASTFGVLL